MPTPETCVAVIPCLNEARTIARVVTGVLQFLPSAIVVDDGSSDGTATLAATAGASVIRRTRPGGKGLALTEGFRHARLSGFPWAIALDGDGQHLPERIPDFLRTAKFSSARMVVGNRMKGSQTMPMVRRWVNRWMSAVISNYCEQDWPDTQCGYRLVNLDSWAQCEWRAEHFEIESELLVRFASAGHRIEFVPVETRYESEQSKIHPLRDSWRWLKWWREVKRELAACADVPVRGFGDFPVSALWDR
jgi:glycosyltransferase involved in cell wall biosynthesis